MSQVLDAPEVGTTEISETIGDGPPEMIAHLYLFPYAVTHCGIPFENDPHACWHMNVSTDGDGSLTTENTCGDCGVPVCKKCLEIEAAHG